MATIFCNGENIGTGSPSFLAESFVSSLREPELFNMALSEITNHGEFEWVDNNEVFLIKNGSN